MEKTIEIPEGYEARIEGNKVILEPKESEDERIRKELLFHIQSEIDTYNNMISGDYDSRDKEDKKVHSMLKRAKAYLERQKEQKPAEWSEEDEALLKEIVSFFKDGTTKLQHDLDLYAGFLENKLKSLHPQPHWKPSEEQMEELEYGIGLLGNMNVADTLRELYADLKKL